MNEQVRIKRFSELTNKELYAIVQVRSDVFVVEQKCPYLDLDDMDHGAIHLWYGSGNDILAYVRVIPPMNGYVQIGRVLSSLEYRDKGLGKQIFKAGITYCQKHYVNSPIKISAQLYLKHFYAKFGFEQIEGVYLEDGIPHITMIKENVNIQ